MESCPGQACVVCRPQAKVRSQVYTTHLTRSITMQWPPGPLPNPPLQTGCWANSIFLGIMMLFQQTNRYAKKLLNCLSFEIFLDHCATSYLLECSQTHIRVFAQLLKQMTFEAAKNTLTHLNTLRKNRTHTPNRTRFSRQS